MPLVYTVYVWHELRDTIHEFDVKFTPDAKVSLGSSPLQKIKNVEGK